MFDLSIPKILVLLIIGLVIFGPEQLPRIAAQAGRALRDLRRLADSAKADLTDSLGPEFREFSLEDLDPRQFVRKHLLDEPASDGSDRWIDDAVAGAPAPAGPRLTPGEVPPFDGEAT